MSRRAAVALLAALVAGLPAATVGAPPAVAASPSPDAVTATSTVDPAGSTSAPADPLEAAQAAVRPVIARAEAPWAALGDGPEPDQDRLKTSLAGLVDSSWLGPPAHVSLTVRDVQTGDHLVDINDDRALVPASVTKLLTAAVVVQTLPMDRGFDTRVVAGSAPTDVVLVAGGDMLLATGAGDPASVSGRAGLGDLADQTAAALLARGVGTEKDPVRIRLDLSYAPGAPAPARWSDYWLAEGYAGPITMLGLARDRAALQHPAPKDPPAATAAAFRTALESRGIVVAGSKKSFRVLSRPADGELLGSVTSAPAREVLGLALADSDNAMVEQLARQAAFADGADTGPKAVAGWVIERLADDYGLDTSDVVLADVSGLSGGTAVPAALVGDLLVAGSDGSHPALQNVMAELPIAGYTGTLWDRFNLPSHEAAVGVARAKTGTLPTVSSLAGIVVTRDGRLLAYVLEADQTGRDGELLEARAVQDEIVARLAACGC